MPPLRERRDDIPQLVSHLMQRFNVELNRSIKGVDTTVATQLHDHPWPGMVRQLESVVKRACILARGDVITADDVGQRVTRAFPRPRSRRGAAHVGHRRAARPPARETGRHRFVGVP